MTHEEIIAMAREAGFDMSRLPSIRAANVYGEVNDELAIFAALVAAKDREACAEIAEKEDVASTDDPFGVQSCIADAIRARGQKEGT